MSTMQTEMAVSRWQYSSARKLLDRREKPMMGSNSEPFEYFLSETFHSK